MKRTAFAVLLATFATITAAHADTLRLRSGTTIEGTFLGADTRQIIVSFSGPDDRPFLPDRYNSYNICFGGTLFFLRARLERVTYPDERHSL
jgi:hypothetical protein